MAAKRAIKVNPATVCGKLTRFYFTFGMTIVEWIFTGKFTGFAMKQDLYSFEDLPFEYLGSKRCNFYSAIGSAIEKSDPEFTLDSI
jgi:hypothetical protein